MGRRMSAKRMERAVRAYFAQCDGTRERVPQAVRMEIEVEREFNFFLRPVTVLVDGEERQELFDSALLTRRDKGAEGLPVEFFISVKAAKQDPFSASAQNELILQLLQAGAIDPKQAVAFMTFEGRDQILKDRKNITE